MIHHKMYQVAFLLSICLFSNISASTEWLDLDSPEIMSISCTADNQFSWYQGPGDQVEWLLNFGASSRTRIKGSQDMTALKFDLSDYRGRTVADAELHLAKADTVPVFALVASTINTDWYEGNQHGSNAGIGESCWRWRKRPADPDHPKPDDEWTFSHSDFSTASFGNYGSLVSYAYSTDETFGSYLIRRQPWLRMKLDPELIHALILDQHGLVVTDPRGYLFENPRVYTKEQNPALAPKLILRFSDEEDVQGPGIVGSLQAKSGMVDSEVILSFSAPEDGQREKAFGYTIRHSPSDDYQTAQEVEPWRIPRPAVPGTIQHVLLENLPPASTQYFFVQAYDQAGNQSPVARVQFTLPASQPPARLSDAPPVIPSGSNQIIQEVPGVLRYWACSEVNKINPVTGNRMADGYEEQGGDEYKKANTVWDAGKNTISVTASRNEVVGCQLIVERLGDVLQDVQISASDLSGPEDSIIEAETCIDLFQIHYVSENGIEYPDAAIPLNPPFPDSFSIPDRYRNPEGVNQSVWMDMYIPKSAVPGLYEGTLSLHTDELSEPLAIQFNVRVTPVVIPDKLSFIIDLNGYGNKWEYGNRELTRLRWFQTCQKHRMSLNTLPYGWSGNVREDRAPTLRGSGSNIQVSSWSRIDDAYGELFDGSAFTANHPVSPYRGPGMNTPVSTFYTPFFESWPIPVLDSRYGFDATGKGGEYWNNLIDTEPTTFWENAPDVRKAFPEDYKQGIRNIVKEWFEHAQEKGWHGTNFQIYLNHKYYYNNCDALWILEECRTADDFWAVGFFHTQFREGATLANAPDVQWHWRLDISNHMGQHYGQIDNLINWYCVAGSSSDWHWPQIRYRNLLLPGNEQWIWYGTGPAPNDRGTEHAQRILQVWAQGLDGGVPYWDNFQTNWGQAEALSTVYTGQNVPGFGQYEGPIMSIRIKMMRQAQQIVELANLLAEQKGWNRERVAQAILSKYGDGSWDRSFDSLEEEEIYQLRADLIETLLPFFQDETEVKQYQYVR